MTKVPEGFSLDWVDALWKRSGDLFMLRDEDGVFILPPNRVYHLNPTAARIIKWLQAGNSIHDFPGLDSEERQLQVDSFFQNIARALANQTHHAKRIPFTFDYTKLPILGEIAVTYRCNNRCRFCYAGCDGACGRLDSPDIEPEKIERIIDIFKSEAKIPFFSFTGGEPLMRKDLERLMRYAVSKDLKINLVTNGTLATPERAKSLYEAGLRTAQISLESPDDRRHQQSARSRHRRTNQHDLDDDEYRLARTAPGTVQKTGLRAHVDQSVHPNQTQSPGGCALRVL